MNFQTTKNPESNRFLPDGTDNKPVMSKGFLFMEIWKEILGYEGRYLLSNCGSVRSIIFNKHRVLVPSKNGRGYYQVGLYNSLGEYRIFRIHTLVALYFISERPLSMEINHKDGNKLNNHVSNLEYCTSKQNVQHAIKLGLRKTGELHGRSKLTEKQVLEIRRKYKWNCYTMQMLCDEYKLSMPPIFSIIHRKTWKHI